MKQQAKVKAVASGSRKPSHTRGWNGAACAAPSRTSPEREKRFQSGRWPVLTASRTALRHGTTSQMWSRRMWFRYSASGSGSSPARAWSGAVA